MKFNYMTFMRLKIPLIFTLVYLATAIQQSCNQNITCPQHSSCKVQFESCKCDHGYIGFCNISAIPLKNQSQQIYLNGSTVSYTYIEPIQHNIFLEITIIICQIDAQQSLTIYLWTQNGHQYLYNPATTFTTPINKQFEQNCSTIILSQYYFSTQTNGQTQKLILGIQSNNNTAIQIKVTQKKSIAIYISYYATLFVMFLLLVSFFGSMILAICKRTRVAQLAFTNNNEEEDETHNIQYFQEYLPKKKLEELMNHENVVCPICLQTIENSQIVRQTPCQHIFHSCCLDSWCIKNVSCPVCRTDLTEDFVKAVKESLQSHKSSQNNKYMTKWQQSIEMSDRTKQGIQIRQRII